MHKGLLNTRRYKLMTKHLIVTITETRTQSGGLRLNCRTYGAKPQILAYDYGLANPHEYAASQYLKNNGIKAEYKDLILLDMSKFAALYEFE